MTRPLITAALALALFYAALWFRTGSSAADLSTGLGLIVLAGLVAGLGVLMRGGRA